ncbi:MAG: hypothetical protein HQL69_23465 [Magnetococcales bacterium]|nr:hypothetical protein [Magnetococcales bacterium]
MMKHQSFIALAVSLLALAVATASPSMAGTTFPYHNPGFNAEMATTAGSVAEAFNKLGYKSSWHRDSRGNPHLVLKNPPAAAKEVAIFFDDCGPHGCEDITFYANFGPSSKATLERINNWNHIGSKTRSKAFISSNGGNPVGLSHTVSFFGRHDEKKIGLSAGLFILEIKLFSHNYLGHK